MGIFDSRSKKERMSAMMGVFIMAYRDGEFSEEEKVVCALIAGRLGLSASELKRVISDPDSIQVTPPRERADRALHIADLIHVAMADGVLDDAESEMLAAMAVAYGFSPSDYKMLIQSINDGDSADTIASKFR